MYSWLLYRLKAQQLITSFTLSNQLLQREEIPLDKKSFIFKLLQQTTGRVIKHIWNEWLVEWNTSEINDWSNRTHLKCMIGWVKHIWNAWLVEWNTSEMHDWLSETHLKWMIGRMKHIWNKWLVEWNTSEMHDWSNETHLKLMIGRMKHIWNQWLVEWNTS